ncbi:MAG: glycosyltransferase family 4 protein [candidate division WOR-3 bacterium]
MPKFGFFTNIPTPHKVYLFNLLNERLKGEIIFYFLSKTTKKRSVWEDSLKDANFPYEILESIVFRVNFGDEGYWFFPKRLPDIKRFKKVVISGGLTPLELFLAFKCVANGVPYIVWSEAIDLFGGNILLRALRVPIRFSIFSLAECVVCGSHMAEKHARTLGAKRTIINYTTTNLNAFLYDKKHSGSCLNIIYLGRLIKRKGVDTLIKAVNGLNWVKLYIVGDGEEKENLETLAKRLNINVEFINWKDYNDIPRFLRKFDILVLPSENEVFGYVVLESLASGVLPITSDGVGSKDLLNDFLIFKVGDYIALRNRITGLKDPKLRNKLINELKEKALRYASPEVWADKFFEILTS